MRIIAQPLINLAFLAEFRRYPPYSDGSAYVARA
jgi:hypothetical protein